MKTRSVRFNLSLAILVAIFSALLPLSNALAASRIFNLHLNNSTNTPIGFKISTQFNSCYEGTPGLGTVLRTVAPGRHTTILLARVQGNGCDGKQGEFAIEVSGQKELQRFNFDNAGNLLLTNSPVSYGSGLSAKSPDESYTWHYSIE